MRSVRLLTSHCPFHVLSAHARVYLIFAITEVNKKETASSWQDNYDRARSEGLLQRVLITKQFDFVKANTYSSLMFRVHNLYRYHQQFVQFILIARV